MSALQKIAPRHDAMASDAPATDATGPAEHAELPAAPDADKPALVTARTDQAPALAQMLQIAAQRFGKSPVHVLGEFARLAIGAGRLNIDEYFAYGLFDDKGLAGADKSHFAGLRAMRDVWMAINWDETWDGVFADKLAQEVIFRGLGLPTTTTVAIYTEVRALPAFRVLSDVGTLAAFLRESANYPLFSKPTDSLQSLGSASFASYDAAADELVGTNGDRFPVEAFATAVKSSYANGYLFQRRLSPHPRVRELAGERLATVRVMTILTKSGPQVLRALWKIPGGSNVADNFWRPGNMIAQLDLETGRIVRVVGGVGVNSHEVETHPDTGARLIGAEVPDWKGVRDLALTGAGVFHKVPLIGWDIAPSEHGPLIVEPNNSPDFGLPQIADRRGLLDERMKALMAERLAEKKADADRRKATFKQELRDERRRVSRSLLG